MHNRLFALLLAVMFFTSACTVLQENNNISDLPSIEMIPVDTEEETQTAFILLYYFDASSGQLVSKTLPLETGRLEEKPRAVLEAFVNCSENIGLGRISEKLQFTGIKISGDVANVYFSFASALSDKQTFYMSVAAANTVIDNLGVSYANILINGKAMLLSGSPCGLFEKSEGNISNLYTAYLEKFSSGNSSTVNLALYFLDPTREYMLPEVRTISLNSSSTKVLAVEVLRQLSLGAGYNVNLISPVERYFTLADPDSGNTTDTLTGQDASLEISYENNTLFINNAGILFPEVTQNIEPNLACVFYSIANLLPEVTLMKFSFGEVTRYMDLERAKTCLGEEITIYLPNESFSALQSVSRVVNESYALNWNTYMEEITRGPIATDPESLVAAFPTEIGLSDFISLDIQGSCAILTLSADFLNSLEGLSSERQMILIYSIVNTICGMGVVNTVQILIQGIRVKGEGEGINLFSPLMPNLGLIS